MMLHILNSATKNDLRAYVDYGFEQILNEKIPHLAEKNPLDLAKLLASHLEKMIKHNMSPESEDSSHSLLRTIEDHEQNNYLLRTIPAICITHLRNCLVRLGETRSTELKGNMGLLEEKKFYIFRRLELFLYEKFPELFNDEIKKSLIEFFDVCQVDHEYYHLLRNVFGKIDDSLRAQIVDMIKSKYQEIFQNDEKKYGPEYANKHGNIWMLRWMEAIHDHLEGEDKSLYERLVEEYGTPSHPDFIQYHETSVQYPVSESELFSGKTIDEMFAIVKEYDFNSSTMPYYSTIVTSFENFVMNNTMECSKRASEIVALDPRIQHAYLFEINRAVKQKKKINWDCAVALVEHYTGSILPNTPHDSMLSHILESWWLIEEGLVRKQIDYRLKDRLWILVQKIIEISNTDAEMDVKYPNGGEDSLTISKNNIGGISFYILFGYVLWCSHNEKSKDVFTQDVKKILEDYVNKNLVEHTISRHSVMGMYVNTMLEFDPEWTDHILPKIFSNIANKLAFWESYVISNQVHLSTLSRLYVWYNEFLNNSITKSMHEREFYHLTIEHVTLGYLYCVKHYDEIFNRFISKADPESLSYCGYFMTRVFSKNPDVAKFKDKIKKMWKTQSFIDHADLNMWFDQKPFDRKESIELFLNYLQLHPEELDPISFPFEKLEKYADEFPWDVAQCIQIFVSRPKWNDFPDTLKPMLEKLLDRKIPRVDYICKQIIDDLVIRGHNDYKDLL